MSPDGTAGQIFTTDSFMDGKYAGIDLSYGALKCFSVEGDGRMLAASWSWETKKLDAWR